MEANAKFINSAANGSIITCPVCGAGNDTDSNYCHSCGNKLTFSQNSVSSDLPQKEEGVKFMDQSENNTEKYKYLAFAQGLPEWSLEPPQMMIRRRNG